MKAELAVGDFGRQIGMEDLSLHPMGRVRLGLASGDWLSLEEHDDDLVVSLVVHCPHVEGAALLTALQMCEVRKSMGRLRMQAGLHGQGQDSALVLAARLPAYSVKAQDISSAVDGCLEWAREWQARTHSMGVGSR